MSKRKTITFEPDDDVKAMLGRATRTPTGKAPWGLRSFLINEALRLHLAKKGFARKREQPA
jgi:hypothetical protein